MELLKYEFKRALKKPVTFLLIALIFFLGINVYNEMSFFDSKIKYNREINNSYYIMGEGKSIVELLRQSYLSQNMINEVEMIDNLLKHAEKAMENYDNENYQESYKNEIVVSMLEARLFCNNAEGAEILRGNIIEIWNELLPEIEYDYFKLSQVESTGFSLTMKKIINIKYKYDLYSKNIRYVDNYSLNNLTFTYNMINKFLPLILCILVVMITFNSISDEYRTGISKNIVTQPFKRSRYYLTMVFANFLSIVIVVLSTMVVLNLLVGFSSSFQSLDTPILTHDKQWNNISITGMDLEKAYNATSTKVYLGPTEVSYDDLVMNLFDSYGFITFKTFLIEAVGVYLLYTFFLTALSVLISSIFVEKMKTLMTLVVIIALGYFAAYLKPSIFNVFSTARVTQIITGSINLTLLGSFLVLGISILITILVGIAYFKRKDITY